MKYKASGKVQILDLYVQATISGGKQFHSLTVDIKYEQEKEAVPAKGCLLFIVVNS